MHELWIQAPFPWVCHVYCCMLCHNGIRKTESTLVDDSLHSSSLSECGKQCGGVAMKHWHLKGSTTTYNLSGVWLD